jgi:hypothetical protein
MIEYAGEEAPRVGRRVIVTGLAGMNEDELREKQRDLLAGDAWIADGNYHATLELRLARADTVVFLDTPWWVWRRLRDEWGLVWRIWRVRDSDRERELGIVSQHGRHAPLHVLRSKRDVRRLLRAARRTAQ